MPELADTWPAHVAREAALAELETKLALTPDDVELRLGRAILLNDLGRTDEAKAAYLALLPLAPTHFGVLNNLAALLFDTGYMSAARTAYAEAVKHHPDNPTGHVNLANALARDEQIELALHHFDAALRLAPDHVQAHQGLARLYFEIGDEASARIHRIKGFGNDPVMALPFRGSGRPIRVLALASAVGGTTPIQHHLDERVFQSSVLFTEFYDPSKPLPAHDFVFNAIGDADLGEEALAAASIVLQHTSKPVINLPSAVAATGRVANAARLQSVPGVIAPKIEHVARERLQATNASADLAKRGYIFPVLVRSPGFHAGRFFVKVDTPDALAAVVADLPGDALMVIQYVDARAPDGKTRKYRVMMIDGRLYPLHAAISPDWKIHYFSAEMADNPAHRAEDEAFLDDMPKAIGARAMTALEGVQAMLGLDYAGADFSLTAEGELILFEANAAMIVYPAPPDSRWDYRRPHVQRVLDAIHGLLTKYAT